MMKSWKNPLSVKFAVRLPLVAGLLAFGVSCAHNAREKVVAAPTPPPLFEWKGDDKTGRTTVEIVLDDQKAYFSIDGEDAGWTYLATGRAGHNTPTGTFKILEKKEDKYSNVWGSIEDADGNTVDGDARNGRESIPSGGRFAGAPMPYWMRLTNSGIGMHVGHIPNPGMPASHGCIRLPRELAVKLFNAVEVGTPVTITGTTPTAKPITPHTLVKTTEAPASNVAMSNAR